MSERFNDQVTAGGCPRSPRDLTAETGALRSPAAVALDALAGDSRLTTAARTVIGLVAPPADRIAHELRREVARSPGASQRTRRTAVRDDAVDADRGAIDAPRGAAAHRGRSRPSADSTSAVIEGVVWTCNGRGGADEGFTHRPRRRSRARARACHELVPSYCPVLTAPMADGDPDPRRLRATGLLRRLRLDRPGHVSTCSQRTL